MLAPMLASAPSTLPHEPRAAAGIPRRGAAALLDGLVLGLALQGLHWGTLALGRPELVTAWQWHGFLAATVTLPAFLYYTLFEGLGSHATPGKRLLGLRVVDTYGGRIPLARAALRTALKLIPWELAHTALCHPEPVFVTEHIGMPRVLFAAYVVGGLYLATMMMSLKKQSVHDWASGTCVVRA